MGVEERSTLVFASGVGRIKEEKPKALCRLSGLIDDSARKGMVSSALR